MANIKKNITKAKAAIPKRISKVINSDYFRVIVYGAALCCEIWCISKYSGNDSSDIRSRYDDYKINSRNMRGIS